MNLVLFLLFCSLFISFKCSEKKQDNDRPMIHHHHHTVIPLWIRARTNKFCTLQQKKTAERDRVFVFIPKIIITMKMSLSMDLPVIREDYCDNSVAHMRHNNTECHWNGEKKITETRISTKKRSYFSSHQLKNWNSIGNTLSNMQIISTVAGKKCVACNKKLQILMTNT